MTGGCSRSHTALSRQSSVVSPAHGSRRATPFATISRVPASPPPTFVLPLVPLPPPYTSRSVSASLALPRLLKPFFQLMTPPPRYESPSPAPSVMGPPPAPRPSSQSTQRLPAPITSNHPAFPSPHSAVRVPTSINHRSLSVGRLPATPSARPEHQESLFVVS